MLADAWLDGELDPTAMIEFERHVRDCPACSRRTEALRSLASTVRSADLYVRAPSGLEAQVRKELGRERHRQNPWRIGAVRWTASAAAVLIAGLIGWSLPRASTRPSDQLIAQEVISAHVRSLMADHLVDVVSSDRHTVKPWFAGKLDFSPDVHDCAADGFPLVGGRLEYFDGHPAAGLVYRHGKHTINVFVWPARHTLAQPVASEANGFHTLNWSQDGMEYWAVSDAAEDSLRSLADCLSGQANAATQP